VTVARKHAGLILEYIRKIRRTHETAQLSDRELLHRFARDRDEAAFATLVRRHGPMVLHSCQRILHNWHDAEEGFQATFLVLARKAASYRWKASVAPWLYRVAHRLALNIRASRERHLQQNAHAVQRSTEDPVAVASSCELCGLLDEELSRLPEKYRAPLVLCALDGYTRDEAARQLGWSLGTLRRRLEQGRILLRQRLVRRGLPLSALFATVLGTEQAVAELSANLATPFVPATVPLGLAQSTVQMGVQSLLGKTVPAALPSSRAATLAEGVLKAMCFTKLKIGLTVALAVCLAGVGAGYALQRTLATQLVEEKPSEREHVPAQQANRRPDKAQPPTLDRYGDPLPRDAVARLGTSRFWCGAMQPNQVAFSDDGTTILAADWCGAFLYDAATGKQLRHIRVSTAKNHLDTVSVSPDGKYLALGIVSREVHSGGIQIWDLTTEQMVREFQDPGGQHHSGLRFSPDGKMLASYVHPSKSICLWDPATGKEIRRWFLDQGFPFCFTFTPDSKTLIVGDLRTIHFWDSATGKELRRMENHPGGPVYRLVLAQDGKILAIQGTEAPQIVKGYSRQASLAYSPDNKLHLWDVATGKDLHQLEVAGFAAAPPGSPRSYRAIINSFRFSPDTKTLATASSDNVLRIWDVATGKELRHWDTVDYVAAFAFSPDGKKLASLGSPPVVRFWDVATGKELREHPSHPSGILVLALSPDGRTLATAGFEREVRLWDAVRGQPQGRLGPLDYSVHALHFSADGRTLTMIEGRVDVPHMSADRSRGTLHNSDGKVRVWDIATGKELRQYPAPVEGWGRRQVLSPDGKSWASDSVDLQTYIDSALIWDAATGKKRQVFAGNKEGGIWALGFSRDSATLYSWSSDKKVRCWDIATGKMLQEFTTDSEVYTGCFSPNGNWLVCGSRKEPLLLYDMATGTVVHRLEIPPMGYGDRHFAISPDSRTLAAGDEDGNIHLVDLASGKFRRHLVGGHQGSISALLFSTDSKRLVSGSTDTTAVVWDLTGQQNTRRKPLGAAGLEARWDDVASDDAERAYQAIGRSAEQLLQSK
jgi:RNA polymerase sigma factor (sigma-70 family)